MTMLTSCWFIIETVLIPNGFLKWFYLSFYIHPLLLFLCQIFLWLKLLQKWLLFIVSLSIQITSFLASNIFWFFRSYFSFFLFKRSPSVETVDEIYDTLEFLEIVSSYEIVAYRRLVTQNVHSLLMNEIIGEPSFLGEDKILEECSSSVCTSSLAPEDVENSSWSSSMSDSVSLPEDEAGNVSLEPLCISDSLAVEDEEGEMAHQTVEEYVDPYYQKYTERMGWFDLLNRERTCGMSAISNQSPEEFSIPYMSWNNDARRRLLRSMENDFELVYVAQSCLSWEALHYQYQKVKALSCSSPQNGAFYDDVAGRFQKFQILLVRFMEDEDSESKRYWNYVHKRMSFNSLLQVPEVSGYMEEGEEQNKGEAVMVTQVLKSIEKCIKAFWLYVKTEKERPSWKITSFLWTCPPVEDPKDLRLFKNLIKTLHKKELWLKDLQGKKKCWLRTMLRPLEESQKLEILFTMIDMRLVSRVLKMSIISTSQLEWCQEKFGNIEFKEGKVIRGCSSSLFPSS